MRRLYTTSVPKELVLRIRAESAETKVPQSRIVEMAVEEFLDKKAKQREAHPAQ